MSAPALRHGERCVTTKPNRGTGTKHVAQLLREYRTAPLVVVERGGACVLQVIGVSDRDRGRLAHTAVTYRCEQTGRLDRLGQRRRLGCPPCTAVLAEL